MSTEKPNPPGKYPGARLKHVPDARKGSTAYMVTLLADARRFAAKFSIDADACWKRAGGIVEAESTYITKELLHALRILLQAPLLNGEVPIDEETNQAINCALEAIELTQA